MELAYDFDQEKDLDEFGIMNIVVFKNEKPCVVCKLVNKEWDSYSLPCGHGAHSRCYRRYLKQINDVLCPDCGVLKFNEKNLFEEEEITSDNDENNLDKGDFNYVDYLFSKRRVRDYDDSKIWFNNLLDLIWSKFFTKLGWKWTYYKNKEFVFKVIVDGIELNVRVVNTDKYEDLKKEYSKIIEKRFRGTFLILGNDIFDYDEIEKQVEHNTIYYRASRCIGLVGYKMYGEKHNTIAFLYKKKENVDDSPDKKKNDRYSLGWIYDEQNWIIDVKESILPNLKNYGCLFKVNAYYHIEDNNCDEIDSLWHDAYQCIRNY